MKREDSLKGRKGLASPPFRNSGFDIGVQRTTLGENPCQESAGRICLLAPLAFSLPLSGALQSVAKWTGRYSQWGWPQGSKGSKRDLRMQRLGPGASPETMEMSLDFFPPTKHLCCGMQGSQCLCMVCCLRLNEEGGLHLLGNLQLTS